MIYTVSTVTNGVATRFGFKTFSEMTEFLQYVLESVDGLNEGTTKIVVAREEETPTKGSL